MCIVPDQNRFGGRVHNTMPVPNIQLLILVREDELVMAVYLQEAYMFVKERAELENNPQLVAELDTNIDRMRNKVEELRNYLSAHGKTANQIAEVMRRGKARFDEEYTLGPD